VRSACLDITVTGAATPGSAAKSAAISENAAELAPCLGVSMLGLATSDHRIPPDRNRRIGSSQNGNVAVAGMEDS
jgi:hypothetical protein